MRVVQTFTVPMSLCFLEGQAQFWQENGYELHVLTSTNNEHQKTDLESFGLRNGVYTLSIPFQRKITIWKDWKNLWLLIRYFKKSKPFIVHGNTPKAAFITMLAAQFNRVPIRIYEMRGLPLETASFWGVIGWKIIEKISCCCATYVIAASPSLRQIAIQNKLVSESKISFVHNGSSNGVDAKGKFNPEKTDKLAIESLYQKHYLPQNQPIIGFVGRLTHDKGIQELYDAWQRVRQAYPNAKLLLIGGEDERKKPAKKLMDKIGNDPTIIQAGEQKNMAEYYAIMNFLVLPSYREGFPNVVLEAAAMGKPAIVSNATGLKDAIIENQTGIFCQPRSAHDLAEKINYYLQNPNIVHLHGEAARQRVQSDFIPSDVWIAKRLLYQRLIAATESIPLRHVSPIFQTTH